MEMAPHIRSRHMGLRTASRSPWGAAEDFASMCPHFGSQANIQSHL